MGQSYNLRGGWQSENLARYLLSKIAFVSQPVTVSDDAGIDFFCTLFEVKKENSINLLLPKNAFAIQVKSKSKNEDEFDITDKETYIRNLEIPFFFGIVDKNALKIEVYSGEYFEFFIAHIGGVPKGKRLFIKLTNERSEKEGYYFKEEKCYIEFPKVIEIDTNFDYLHSSSDIKPLFETCELMLKNIAARIKGVNLFETYGNRYVRIYTGSYSARMCRENFYKALTEIFYNLDYMHKNGVDVRQEVEIYKTFFKEIQTIRDDLPPYLIDSFQKIEK